MEVYFALFPVSLHDLRVKIVCYFCVLALILQGYPEGHLSVIKPVADASTLSASEQGRLVKTSEGLFVCSDAVRMRVSSCALLLCSSVVLFGSRV